MPINKGFSVCWCNTKCNTNRNTKCNVLARIYDDILLYLVIKKNNKNIYIHHSGGMRALLCKKSAEKNEKTE